MKKNMKHNIGILESVHPEGIKLLKNIGKVYLDVNLSKPELYKKIHHYDVVIIKSNIQINEKFINCAKRLKIVARAGTGVDNINLEYLKNSLSIKFIGNGLKISKYLNTKKKPRYNIISVFIQYKLLR